MLKINEFEGKTLEEATNKAITELNANLDEIFISDSVEETGKLFKSTKHVIKVIEVTELKRYIKEIIADLSRLLEIDLNSEIRVHENIFNVLLVSSNNAILIGKEGKTLEAIQTLIRQIVQNNTDMDIKVNIDIADYKNNKIKNLERVVKKIAYEVQKNSLDLMKLQLYFFEPHMLFF